MGFERGGLADDLRPRFPPTAIPTPSDAGNPPFYYEHHKRKQLTISPRRKGSGCTWKKREHRRGFQEGGAFMIRKVKGGYKVVSELGKNLGGPYRTKAAAQKRL